MTDAFRWLFGIPRDATNSASGWNLRLIGVPANLWALMGLLVVFGFLGWLTVRSYRREGQTHKRLKGGLTAIRLTVLAILLVLALQPAVVAHYQKSLPSEVAVLVDDSLSMRWADRYDNPAERAALAASTGVKPEQLDSADRPQRLDLVRGALDRQGGPLAKLAADHPLSLFRFGAPAAKGTYTELLGTMDGAAARPAGLDKLTADGFETNVGRAVRDVLDKLEGRRLAALVVVSDGQNTSPAAAGRLAAVRELLKDRGVPVYAVAVGDPTPPKNLAVAQMQGPGEVRKGSVVSLTAVLTQRGYAGREVTVDLLRAPAGTDAWEKTGTSERVTLEGEAGANGADAGKLQEVTLRTEAQDVGEFVYKARVEPLADEMLRTDNEAKANVRVSDEKVAVLLVSGDANWEFQFLRNYLLKHPEHYHVSLWQQNADAAFNQDASTGMKLSALPLTRDELFKYDVIILHDPRYVPGSLDAAFLNLLEEFVGKHHGGLAYLAGNKFTDANLLGGGTFDPLAKLLPVVLRAEPGGAAAALRTRRTATKLELTPEGADHPLTQLGAGPSADENRKAWDALPGIFRTHAVDKLKTLATALAVSADPSRTTSDGQREPAIAVQYYGKGRVLYHGFDQTWRWRYVDDAKAYYRFWGNVVDFLAAGRLEKKRILITTGGDVFDAGSDIRVRVEAYNRDFSPMEGNAFTVTLARAGGAGEGAPTTGPAADATDYTLQKTKDGFFEGTVPATRTGTFVVKAKANAAGQADWLEEDVSPRRIEVRLPEEEFRRPEANFQTLRELAGDDARFLRLADIDQLPQKVPAARQTSTSEVPHTIWNSWFTLLLLGSLLLTEWTLRKLFNMV